MTEIKLTKRYPQSRTEDIVDAYMRGWNDALDAVQNGKFIINDDRKTENCSEIPNNCEEQTETEIAKAIVHKMIDDAVIAEDAYPDLRQKMHDAVDEYEPQTDCAWK